jgi:serine/threonine protein phosphatase PrpC
VFPDANATSGTPSTGPGAASRSNQTSAGGGGKGLGELVRESDRFVIENTSLVGNRDDQQDAVAVYGALCHSTSSPVSTDASADVDLVAVFDGHGSEKAAVFAASNIGSLFRHHLHHKVDSANDSQQHLKTIMTNTFTELDEKMSEWAKYFGATAVVAGIVGNDVVVGNAGDCRCVVTRRNKKTGEVVSRRITVDHKTSLSSEIDRISALGGVIDNDRVQGVLAVTRVIIILFSFSFRFSHRSYFSFEGSWGYGLTAICQQLARCVCMVRGRGIERW